MVAFTGHGGCEDIGDVVLLAWPVIMPDVVVVVVEYEPPRSGFENDAGKPLDEPEPEPEPLILDIDEVPYPGNHTVETVVLL